MQHSERWPIDYETIAKGDIIPVSRIEQIVGQPRTSVKYPLALLALKERIERELRDRGKLWTLRSEDGALKVCTDAEASVYNHSEQQRARRMMARRFELESAVDVSALTDDQRKQHERNVEIDGKYIQAIVSTRRELKLHSHKRSTPALPS